MNAISPRCGRSFSSPSFPATVEPRPSAPTTHFADLLPVVEHPAADRIVLGPGPDQIDDAVAEAPVRSCRNRRVDECLIQGDPANRQAAIETVDRREGPSELMAEPDDPPGERRQVMTVAEAVEHPKLLEPSQGVGEHHVGGDRVAGETVPVDVEDVPATLGERDSESRAGAARPNDDHGPLLHLGRAYGLNTPTCESGHWAASAALASSRSR
jgi:hypothetical protein